MKKKMILVVGLATVIWLHQQTTVEDQNETDVYGVVLPERLILPVIIPPPPAPQP